MLSFTQVTKNYGPRRGVRNLSLQVLPGEIFGFLGPNGAGKSTSIRIAVGLLSADGGHVEICGHDIQKEPSRAKRCLGYVPDEPYVHPKLTGREFLELACHLWSVPRDEIADRIEQQLGSFDLAEYADHLAETYSHGTLQKFSIASALIHEPSVLILDEPMVGLDPRAARTVKDLLREHCAKGNSVFFSTHVLDVAERLCDRVGIIDHSQLIAVGTLEELTEADRAESLEDVFLSLTKAAS